MSDAGVFEERYFEDPHYPPGLKGGDEVRGYGYFPGYFPVVEAQLASLIELTDAGSLLDAGCGKGALASYARTDLGVATVGLDFSAYATRIARRTPGGERTVRATCTHLPFRDAAFDVVWSNGVLQYLEAAEARQALAELGRVTRRAAMISNIAAIQRQGDWARRDHLTRLYLRPAQWERLAAEQGLRALALPFEGEAAILLLADAPPSLALRFVDVSLRRMERLGALARRPPALEAFRERVRRGR